MDLLRIELLDKLRSGLAGFYSTVNIDLNCGRSNAHDVSEQWKGRFAKCARVGIASRFEREVGIGGGMDHTDLKRTCVNSTECGDEFDM